MSESGVNVSNPPLIRFGMTFWVVVSGLLLLNVAVFADVDRLVIQQFLARLDFRYWSTQIAYPLWLFFALLLFDAVTFRRAVTQNLDSRKNYDALYDLFVLTVKFCIVLMILYFIITSYFIIRGWWDRWCVFSFLFITAFFIRWYGICGTSRVTGITAVSIKERRQFLIMSIVITGEISVISFLQMTWLIRPLYYSLEKWFGFGAYSHIAALTFVLICTALAVTFYVIKEWLAAVRKSLSKTETQSSSSEVSL